MRTWLTVDLKKFKKNLSKIKAKLSPNTKILAVVKADAYGHGAVAIANSALAEGVHYLGVATVDEAIELREAGIKAPILVLAEPIKFESMTAVLYYNLSLSVYSQEFLKHLMQITSTFHKPINIHLKIDTGMCRIGVDPKNAVFFASSLKNQPFLNLEGIFTHLSDADSSDTSFTNKQLQVFNEVVSTLKENNIEIPLIHAANSAGIFFHPNTHFNMVRAGINLYRNIIELKTNVIYIRKISKGTPVGYSQTFIAPKAMNVGVLSIGYGDGYSRMLSNKGQALIKEQLCPIIGNICMDMTMVQLPDNHNINIGDEAIMINSANKEISAKQIAKLIGTIDYEVMTNIGKRVPRIYQ